MVKGFVGRIIFVRRNPFLFYKNNENRGVKMKTKKSKIAKKAIGFRKSCTASGTGLSHYILIKDK
jgi:modified peptide precursor CbpA